LRLKNEQENTRHHQEGDAHGNGYGLFSVHFQSGFMAIDLTTDVLKGLRKLARRWLV
jgi:hypothetical protein